jgi:Zn-finger nucleic acid-binding protein
MPDENHVCPKCGHTLEHFSGLENIPEYDYCPVCMDWAYNEEGEKIAPLV